MRSLLMSLAALSLLIACGPTTTPTQVDTPTAEAPVAAPTNASEATAQDLCGAAAFAQLVGMPASGIDQAALPAGTRIITPTTMVTQDFNPARLNVVTDANGNVASLSCY